MCARSYTGVKCWGANEHGQLGYGNTENIGDDELPSAVGFVQLPEGADHVWANGNHSCVTSLGKVTCWGSNDDGELGKAEPGQRLSLIHI